MINKIKLEEILEYYKKNLINDSLKKIETESITDKVRVLMSYTNKFGNNYDDSSDFDNYYEETYKEKDFDIFIEDEINNIFRSDYKFKRKKLPSIDFTKVHTKLKKKLDSLNKDGFFNEIYELRAMRTFAIKETISKIDISKIPTDVLSFTNELIKNGEGFTLNDLNVFNVDYIWKNLYSLYKYIPEEMDKSMLSFYPLSLKENHFNFEKYSYPVTKQAKNQVSSKEGDFLEKKGRELLLALTDEIETIEGVYLENVNKILSPVISHIMNSENSNVINFKKFFFDRYVERYLIHQNIEKVDSFISIVSLEDKISVINSLNSEEVNTGESYCINLMEFAREKKDYKKAFNYLQFANIINKNTKKGLITPIVRDLIKENRKAKILDYLTSNEKLDELILEVFNQETFFEEKRFVYEKLNSEDGIPISINESKEISVPLDILLYMLDKDIRNKPKGIVGSFFNGEMKVAIENSGDVSLYVRTEGVSKVSNKELLLDIVDVLNAIINNELPLNNFNKLKLKAKLKSVEKEEKIVNRKKI